VPYLDRELVEYVERLPQKFKVRFGARKWAHRRVCAEFLPAEILRRKKRGFAVNVVDDWFRGAMNTRMTDTFLDSTSLIYQYLRPAAVQRIFRQHQAGQNDHYKILFSMIVFEQWLRVHSLQDAGFNPACPVQVANAV
jgi:asparagine synthase (glutamine-hydrolysing)